MIGLRRDKRYMRPHKPDGEKERILRLGALLNQFTGFGGSLAVGMHQIITLRGDHNKGVATHRRLPSVRVVFQSFAQTGCFPFRPLAVESFCP